MAKIPPANNVQDFRLPGASDEKRIGHLLVEMGVIATGDVERILALQKNKGMRFGEAAQQLGLISDEDIQRVLSKQFGYPRVAPGDGSISPELITAYLPSSPQAEALRTLRSQLKLRWFNRKQKMLAVVGCERNSGSSYVAANLAVAFSQLGERTLLVDADLRTPRQREIFRLANREGLSDILAGKADLEEMLQKPGYLPDLSILGAGTIPPNPQELLSRRTFALLLQGLTSRFDVIILDTFPSVAISDSETVASLSGGALVVIRPNHTRLADAALLKDRLRACSTQLVGALVNQY